MKTMGKTYSTGLIVSPAEIQHNMAMFVAMAKLLRAVEHPSSFDWRSIEGEDFTTPIRDQGKCSSSVAFATIALMESMIKIANQDPKLQPDLSEAYLFPRGGGKCESGAQFGRMLTAAESGVCDELCCPYAGDWKPCPDFKSRLTAITFSETIFSPEQAKAHIASTGPLMSGMAVYADFFEHDGGIYSQDYGNFVGNHAILIVGYDEGEDCWIGKNSWGLAWGDGGWFRIKQGECGIGSAFPFYSAAIGLSPVLAFPPSPDIAAPIDGTLYVTMTRAGERDVILLVNNREIGALTLGETLTAGEFKRGDTIQFDLVGIAHKNVCFPSGWRIWTLRMDGGKYEFRVLERDKR
ncbi:MAG: putative Papain family cysteine protease [Methanothrix sp.]|jgi:hypothetical protein|nr:MAG: putative Papain family cysteine protease [Methanothrix sp.]